MDPPFVVTALFLICLLTVPVLGADGGVVRSLSADTLPAGGTVDVTLTLPQDSILGIVETIPEGFAFAGTNQPDGRYKVSGRQIIFSALNETTIVYTLRAEAGGSGTITGLWEDFSAGTSGEIPAASLSAESGAAGNVPAAAQKSPGFGLVAAAGAALIVCRRCLR